MGQGRLFQEIPLPCYLLALEQVSGGGVSVQTPTDNVTALNVFRVSNSCSVCWIWKNCVKSFLFIPGPSREGRFREHTRVVSLEENRSCHCPAPSRPPPQGAAPLTALQGHSSFSLTRTFYSVLLVLFVILHLTGQIRGHVQHKLSCLSPPRIQGQIHPQNDTIEMLGKLPFLSVFVLMIWNQGQF